MREYCVDALPNSSSVPHPQVMDWARDKFPPSLFFARDVAAAHLNTSHYSLFLHFVTTFLLVVLDFLPNCCYVLIPLRS